MKQEPRFIRNPQIRACYDGYVCYIGIERQTGLQVFWYEFPNDNLSPELQAIHYRQLVDAQTIQSNSILRILDVSLEDVPPRFIVVTENIPTPLDDYLQSIKTALPLRTCVKWFRDICDGVQALHAVNMIHGAISMQTTYIIQRKGSVKIKMPLTTLSGRVSPPSSIDLDRYHAPETLKGVRSKAIDIWSIGIIFLELVTNSQAYAECETAQELINALIMHQKPQALQLVQARNVVEFIELCLAEERLRPTIEDVLNHPVLQTDEQGVPTFDLLPS
jgi:WNK lysine deficient protein kinase